MRSSRRTRLALAAALAGAAACGCAPAAPVRVEHAWVRAADSAGTTAAYFTLVNDGADSLHVTGVGGDAATSLSLHETVHVGALASMRELEHLDVAPRTRVAFAPGGRHVMLVGLRRALAAGTRVNLALHLSGRQDLPIDAEVRP